MGKAIASLNITPEGLLLSNPWAYISDGKPAKYAILGDIKKNKLSTMAGKSVPKRLFIQARRNF